MAHLFKNNSDFSVTEIGIKKLPKGITFENLLILNNKS